MSAAAMELTLDQFTALCDRTIQELASLDFTEPLKVSEQLLIADVKENFAGSHDPDGQPWADLKFPHLRGGTTQLRDTGVLMGSVTGEGQGHVSEITSHSLVFGTNHETAAIHNFGGTITPKGHPMLSIPLTREARDAGGASKFPRPLFVFKRDGKLPLLAEKKDNGGKKRRATKGEKQIREKVAGGEDKELVFHYLLAPEVTIPKREFLGWSNKVLTQIDDVLAEFIAGKLFA